MLRVLKGGQKGKSKMEKDGFVNLHEIDTSILIDIKYASNDNFVGHPISGYLANRAYLKEEAGKQIQKIQAALKKHHYSMIVYEAYRPQKASEFFFAWCQEDPDQKMKSVYYPNVEKKHFFNLGYLARQSSHTRGIAIDVSLVDLSTGRALDMGGHFDFFDDISHTLSGKLRAKQLENRLFLKSVMEDHGFENLPTEWWHYALRDADGFNEFYDFDVS